MQFPRQLGRSTSAMVWACLSIPVLIIAIGVAICVKQGWTTVEMMLRDPVQSGDLPYHAGVISNAGVLVWMTATIVPIFAGILLWRLGNRNAAKLPLAGGTFSGVLMVDDFFLLHEGVFPHVLGIAEVAVFGAYGFGLIAILWSFRAEWRLTEALLLTAAMCWFVVSVLLDVVPVPMGERLRYLAEDTAKLLGIVHWCAFFVRTSYARVLVAATEGVPSPQTAAVNERMPMREAVTMRLST